MEPLGSKLRETTKADVVAWVERWKAVNEITQKERKRSWVVIPLSQTIENLDDAFQSALYLRKASLTSGLVEQQRFFLKSRL